MNRVTIHGLALSGLLMIATGCGTTQAGTMNVGSGTEPPVSPLPSSSPADKSYPPPVPTQPDVPPVLSYGLLTGDAVDVYFGKILGTVGNGFAGDYDGNYYYLLAGASDNGRGAVLLQASPSQLKGNKEPKVDKDPGQHGPLAVAPDATLPIVHLTAQDGTESYYDVRTGKFGAAPPASPTGRSPSALPSSTSGSGGS